MRKILIHFLLFLEKIFIALFIGFILGLKYSSPETVKARKLSEKHLELLKLAVKWIKEPEQIEKFIEKNKDKTIGIYGMSYLGDCLQKVVRKKGVTSIYGIDRNANRLYNPYLSIYSTDDELPDVDIIIVTAFMSFESIKQNLKIKVKKGTNIISLEDIFYR